MGGVMNSGLDFLDVVGIALMVCVGMSLIQEWIVDYQRQKWFRRIEKAEREIARIAGKTYEDYIREAKEKTKD